MLDARAIQQQLQAADSTGRPAILQGLSDAVRSDATAPIDELLEVLRPFGRPPTWDRDPKVRRAVHETVRALARVRGERRGLRHVPPTGTDLGQLESGPVFWAAIELVWDAVSIYQGPEVLETGLALATEPQRGLYAIWWTRSEVENGGFSQYFWNDTGVVAPHAVKGFRLIGATALADVVEGAMRLFGPEFPLGRAARNEALEKLPGDAFEALDQAFYRESETLDALAGAYVRGHLAAFFEG